MDRANANHPSLQYLSLDLDKDIEKSAKLQDLSLPQMVQNTLNWNIRDV
jgi:hypothetical protein